MATGGLYGSSATGALIASPGAETAGLYGNTTNFSGTFFEWFIFQEASTQPATPTGGSWNFVTQTGTPPAGWSNSPPSAPTNQIWVSIAFVNSLTTSTLTWSTPGLLGVIASTNVGTTTTGAPGTSASVTNSGTSLNAVLNFTIPRGDTGATGATGTAATITAGTTTTTAPGTSATVTNVGTSSAAVFNFGIPRGAGVVAGGTTGQVLAKASSTDYDTSWITITGALNYQGNWNASTNTPTLNSSVGTNGYYYTVSVAGTTNLNGVTDWQVGDWAIFNGTVWQKIDQTNQVTSVNGQTGGVVLTAADVGALSGLTSTDGSVTITSPTTTTRDLSVATAASTTNVLCQVRNTTGATLTKGTAVYISGATGQIPTVSKALATSDATSAQTLGLMTADLANNSNGFVTVVGLITNIDTSAYTDGAQLYLSGTTAGTLTATKQYAPIHLVYMAVVEYAHPTQGKLFVKVQNGYELDEIHNVSAQSPTTGQTIVYNSATSLWEKNTVSLTAGVNGTLPIANGGTNGTATPTAGAVPYGTGSAYAFTTAGTTGQVLTSNGASAPTWTTLSSSGTVTSVNVSGGTTGLTTSGGPVTTSGTITLAGTLALANGGTGATTVAGAQTNLQVDPAGTAVSMAIALG